MRKTVDVLLIVRVSDSQTLSQAIAVIENRLHVTEEEAPTRVQQVKDVQFVTIG